MTEIPITYITIDNLNIAQAHLGEGDPVLMLHGWGANIDLLWPLGEALARYGYSIHMLDLPGFGKSDSPSTGWTVFDYAEFVIRYLDAHKLDGVHLFGHSFGGRLGLILGADYADRINKMALSNSAGVLPKKKVWPQVRLRSYKAIRTGLQTIGLNALSDNLRQKYNARYGSSDFQQLSGAMRETFVQVVNQDLVPHAARVKASTLLFWGDADEDTPLWMGQLLEETIPDAGLVVHDGTGHYAYLDRLSETARVMDYFFKQDNS